MSKITSSEYGTLSAAYAFFNQELFGGSLPDCLITLQRKAKAYGYFSPNRFSARQGGGAIDEIALNPDLFGGEPDEEILGTLVHEMAHLWQQHHGKPSRGNYHNKEWADKMQALGLVPSDTGQPGGKMTGQSMSHYIDPNGPFIKAARKFLARNGLQWQSAPIDKQARASKSASKTKFTCISCGLNAWGKPSAKLVCGECMAPMEPEQGGECDD